MTLGQEVVIGAGVLVVAQVVIAVLLANYGANRGYPFYRLLLCTLFTPWPVAFLLIVLAADRDEAAAWEHRRSRMGWAAEEAALARRLVGGGEIC